MEKLQPPEKSPDQNETTVFFSALSQIGINLDQAEIVNRFAPHNGEEYRILITENYELKSQRLYSVFNLAFMYGTHANEWVAHRAARDLLNDNNAISCINQDYLAYPFRNTRLGNNLNRPPPAKLHNQSLTDYESMYRIFQEDMLFHIRNSTVLPGH
jgi:hypothetical protein